MLDHAIIPWDPLILVVFRRCQMSIPIVDSLGMTGDHCRVIVLRMNLDLFYLVSVWPIFLGYDDPLRSILNFQEPIKILNSTPICLVTIILEIFLKWGVKLVDEAFLFGAFNNSRRSFKRLFNILGIFVIFGGTHSAYLLNTRFILMRFFLGVLNAGPYRVYGDSVRLIIFIHWWVQADLVKLLLDLTRLDGCDI